MIRGWRNRLERRYLDTMGYASGREFTREIVASVDEESVFLDAGCGEGKIRELLPEGVRYIGTDYFAGADSEGYAGWRHRPTVVSDLHHIPLKDASCDIAVILHVLEHVRSPLQVMTEIARVLKPGGRVFISVPFLHQIHHGPNDHYRFTRFALEDLLRTAGFEPLAIRPSGGYFRALGHVLELFLPLYRRQTAGTKVLLLPLLALAAALRLLVRAFEYPLDLLDSKQELTCGYLCSAVKKRQGNG